MSWPVKLEGYSVHFTLEPIHKIRPYKMLKQIIWARKRGGSIVTKKKERGGSIGCAGVMINCPNWNENEPHFYLHIIH